jgi:hypothetical protein
MAKQTIDLNAPVITRDQAIQVIADVHTDMERDVKQLRAQIECLEHQLSDTLGEFRGLSRVWNRCADGDVSDEQLSAWVEEYTGYSPAVLDDAPDTAVADDCEPWSVGDDAPAQGTPCVPAGTPRVNGCTGIMHPIYCHCGDSK